MTKAELDAQFYGWALWYASRRDGGIGYKKQTIEYELMRTGTLIRGTGEYVPPTNEDAERMERIITRMWPEQQEAVKWKYLRVMPNDKARAREMGVATTTYQLYLREAQQFVLGALCAVT